MTKDAEQQDLATYETNIDKIVHDLASNGSVVYIALLDDQSKRPVAAHPANPPALMSVHVRAYNDIIRRVAAHYGATTVDFYNTTIFTDPATLYSDGNHPNEAGYDAVAAKWFAALGLK